MEDILDKIIIKDKTFTNYNKIQLGSTRTDSECMSLETGGYFPNTSPYWQEFYRIIENDEVHPQSISMIKKFGSAKFNLEMSRNGVNGMPYNIVAIDHPLLPYSALTIYPTGLTSAPVFVGQSQENWYNFYPPTTGQAAVGDHHVMTYVTNEDRTKLIQLWELYQCASMDSGITWSGKNLNMFDLISGTPPRDGYSTSNAAGTPITPFLLNRDEISRGSIDHVTLCSLPNLYVIGRYIWPARNYNGAAASFRIIVNTSNASQGDTVLNVMPLRPGYGSNLYSSGTKFIFTNGVSVILSSDAASSSTNLSVYPIPGSIPSGHAADAIYAIPFGARLRLNSDWYNANIAGYSNNIKIILNSFKKYGIMPTDLSAGSYLTGIADNRWTDSELAELRTIPLSAFEVTNFTPTFTINCPTSGAVNKSQSITCYHNISGMSNFSQNVYLYWTKDNVSNVTTIGSQPCNDNSRGPYNFTFTPTQTGVYIIFPHYYEYWLEPPPVAFIAY